MLKHTQKLLAASVAALTLSTGALAADVKLRLAASASPTDARSVAMEEVLKPSIASFSEYEGYYGASVFAQGTELEAIARGNLEMSIASAQELAEFFPEFSIFSAGYVHRDYEHQRAVFNSDFMKPLKAKAEEELGIKLLDVIYLGKRSVNLRDPNGVRTPSDLEGVKLRMPGSEAWLFLGSALGANPAPVPYGETYTALQSGAVDGQDNPLPNTVDMKFYEVTGSITLTNHLVDLNYLAVGKKFYDGLTADQQQQLRAAASAAAATASARIIEKEASLRAYLEEKGIQFHEPDLDAFRTQVQNAYLESDYSKNWVPGMIDQINAL